MERERVDYLSEKRTITEVHLLNQDPAKQKNGVRPDSTASQLAAEMEKSTKNRQSVIQLAR